jgi:hypothetical protein
VQFEAHCIEKEEWKYVEGAEMNERVTSKSAIAKDFIIMSKCMFSGRAPPGPAERV